jgi:hypothetical protein
MRDFLGPPDDHRNTLNGREQSWPTLRHQHIGLPKLRNDLFRRMALPANLRIVARHRGEHMRTDPFLGIADRDGNLNGRIEHFAAAVRRGFMRVTPYVQFLRRAADVDRDRLERELGLARRLGGGRLLDLRSLCGVFGGGSAVELRLRVGFGGVELRRSAPKIRVNLLGRAGGAASTRVWSAAKALRSMPA